MRRVLITGGAGFIGSHLAEALLKDGWPVVALDNLDDFYDPRTKLNNINQFRNQRNFTFVRADIRNPEDLHAGVAGEYDTIVHLAAKAGVRPSIKDPHSYQECNARGTQNMLEFAKNRGVRQFIYASSSSVYGLCPDMPWREDSLPRPVSPYAAAKLAGEIHGHVYSFLYGIRFLALRFFTVYGARQRPDLAIHKFALLLSKGQSIPIFGDGGSRRDYTFISDIIGGIRTAMDYTASMFEVINLGTGRMVSLLELVSELENVSGIKARIEKLPEQPGDVPATLASLQKAHSLLNYSPCTEFDRGLKEFWSWFVDGGRLSATTADVDPSRDVHDVGAAVSNSGR